MKEKYPVSGFTRDKEAIYVNGIASSSLQNIFNLWEPIGCYGSNNDNLY